LATATASSRFAQGATPGREVPGTDQHWSRIRGRREQTGERSRQGPCEDNLSELFGLLFGAKVEAVEVKQK
jgi:hypothetical protein